jgi:1-acyl-sn-glycerol-3-phosphate acyltransferase
MSSHEALLDRPDIIEAGGDRLGRIERYQIAFIRKTFDPGALNGTVRWLQRHVGSTWIHHFTKNLVHLHGLERLPPLDAKQSFVCVCNHRSFFDLYVVTAALVRRGLPHRIAFPVRANFFYDRALGFAVNGAMSFFAMYPPIFRERSKVSINVTSLSELAWLLRRGGTFAGVHPEGTRNLGDDPYTFLPAQRGVGRLIYEARVPVLPVFINGLVNDLARQVLSNFDGTGQPVHVVFGSPVSLDDLLGKARSPRVDRAIAERALEAISALGEEEKRIRAAG